MSTYSPTVSVLKYSTVASTLASSVVSVSLRQRLLLSGLNMSVVRHRVFSHNYYDLPQIQILELCRDIVLVKAVLGG